MMEARALQPGEVIEVSSLFVDMALHGTLDEYRHLYRGVFKGVIEGHAGALVLVLEKEAP